MKAKSSTHPRLQPPALTLLLAALLLPVPSLAVDFWTCPILNLNNTVTCTCDLTHSLQCHDTSNDTTTTTTTDTRNEVAVLEAITGRLRSLPADNRVLVLELRLDGLSDLPDGTFEGTGLQALVLARHRMAQLRPAALRGLSSSLVALAVTSGTLTAVPTTALSEMEQLVKVDLSDNNILEITPDNFQPLDHLQELNLAGNGLHSAGVFRHNLALRKLILDSNQLTGVGGLTVTPSTGVSPFPNLRQLSLAHNLYRDVFRANFLPEMKSLERLSLAANQLALLEAGSFASCPHLQYLDLSYNSIVVLREGAFRELGNLSTLDLSHNRLAAYRSPFVGLTALTVLALNDNYLRAVDGGLFSPLRSVQTLDLSDNVISYVHHQAFDKIRSLQSLDLEDNPLVCDCKLREFAAWLHKTSNLPEHQKRLATCTVPARLHGLALLDVTSRALTCSDKDIPPESLTRMEREEKQAALRRMQDNPVPNRFDAVDDSGLQLVDYDYDGVTITLNWLVSPELLPVTCDAVFIFEGTDPQKLHLQNKIQTECEDQSSDAIGDDAVLGQTVTVRVTQVTLRQPKTYQLCLAVIHLRTLVLGCSELLHLDPESSMLVANNPMELAGNRHHHHQHEDSDLDAELERRYREQIAKELEDDDRSQEKKDKNKEKAAKKSEKHDKKAEKHDQDGRIEKQDGKITIEKQSGNIKIEKQDGSIRIEKDGHVKFEKQDGNIRIEKPNGNVRIDKQDGSIRIEKPNGNVRVEKQDGSIRIEKDGQVKFEKQDGNIRIEKPNRYIKVEKQDGNVRIEKDGHVKFEKQDDNIRIGKPNGNIRIEKQDDNIRIEKDGHVKFEKKDGIIRVEKEDGNIKIEKPHLKIEKEDGNLRIEKDGKLKIVKQDSRHRNDNQDPESPDLTRYEPPSIVVNTSNPTSLLVTWQFKPEQPPPIPCTMHIMVMRHDREVDRRLARCDDDEETPEVTFTGLNLQLSDYRVCAEYDRDETRHHQNKLQKKCVPLVPGTTGGHWHPGALMTIGIVIAFLVFALLVGAFVFQMGRRLCRPSPKTVGLLNAGRAGGSTQYRVFYQQPGSEQPLVHSAA